MGRPLKKRSSVEIIKIVEGVRRRNNKLWMGLLVLAVKTSPRKSKKIIREIVENDRKVSAWMARI
jgi:hypothetical protein